MSNQAPPKPRFPIGPLDSETAEADCAMIAALWRQHGLQRATLAMFMVQWLTEPVRWETDMLVQRVQTLYWEQ